MGTVVSIGQARPRGRAASRPLRRAHDDALAAALAGQRLLTAEALGERLGGRSPRQIYDDRQAGMPAVPIGRGARPTWRYPERACLLWHGLHDPAELEPGGDDPTTRTA